MSETSIKYESPYSAESIYDIASSSPSLKRQRSEHLQETADKLQRINSDTALAKPQDLTAFLALATACTPSGSVPLKVEEHIFFENYQQINDTGLNEIRVTSDSIRCMRILSLPVLESLATQIISLLAKYDYHEIISIVTTPRSEIGQVYVTLKSLFDQTKKIYSPQGNFLSSDALNFMKSEERAIVRLSNLATFICSVFGGNDVGFLELNEQFINTFTIEGSPLQKEPGDLFLNLKTQMYLSAVSQEEQERTREDILEDFFPNDLEKSLSDRHPDHPLSQSEMEFMTSYITRREFLCNAPIDLDSIQALSENFSWEGFLKQMGAYFSKISLLMPFMKKYGLNVSLAPPTDCNMDQTNSAVEDNLGLQVELAAKQTLESLGLSNTRNLVGKNMIENHYTVFSGSINPDYSSVGLPKEQTAPTQVLYERARQAAVAKASPSITRRPGLPSQRRPWSGEEERALMAGLDHVRGPYWSQILALYGVKGTINEVLKDRNQVQLKDKARNLKLFFLKSGIEVPYYLKTVTGELKTRAPTQAAKREAEERARLVDIEDQNHIEDLTNITDTTRDCDPISPLFISQKNDEIFRDSMKELERIVPESIVEPSEPSEDQELTMELIQASFSQNGGGHTTAINIPSMAV